MSKRREGGGKQPPKEEAAAGSATATPPPETLKDGLCPTGCPHYDHNAACACGEGHRLSMQQHTVVHLSGAHWNASCGFMSLLTQVQAM